MFKSVHRFKSYRDHWYIPLIRKGRQMSNKDATRLTAIAQEILDADLTVEDIDARIVELIDMERNTLILKLIDDLLDRRFDAKYGDWEMVH